MVTLEEQIVVKIRYNVKKNLTSDEQVYAKLLQMHFVFYSERDTKIILIVNFVLRRIPGKSCGISTCWRVTTWNRSVPRLTRRSWFAWSRSMCRRIQAGRRSCRGSSTSCTCTTGAWQTSPRRRCCRGWAAAWTSTGSALTLTTRRKPSWASPSEQDVATVLVLLSSSAQWGWFSLACLFSAGHWMTACTK